MDDVAGAHEQQRGLPPERDLTREQTGDHERGEGASVRLEQAAHVELAGRDDDQGDRQRPPSALGVLGDDMAEQLGIALEERDSRQLVRNVGLNRGVGFGPHETNRTALWSGFLWAHRGIWTLISSSARAWHASVPRGDEPPRRMSAPRS